MPQIITGILLSYFIGAVPVAYIVGRLVKGIDIREYGSGNVGATNVFRVLGKPWGILVFVLDTLKGILPVVILGNYFAMQYTGIVRNLIFLSLGISSILGHIWTIFLRFKGGKGVATSLGVLLGLATQIQGLGKVIFFLIILWIFIFAIFRMVSLASVAAAFAFPVFTIIFGLPIEIIVAAFILATCVIWRHQPNIRRILQGKEFKFKTGNK